MFNLRNNAARQRERQVQDRLVDRIAASTRKELRKEFDRVARKLSEDYSPQEYHSRVKIALEGHAARISAILRKLYKRTGETFSRRVRNSVKSLGRNIETKDDDSVLQQFLETWASRMAELRSAQMSRTTERLAFRAAEQGIIAGDTYRQIEKRIRASTGGSMGRIRARRIARTEAHTASQAASEETVRVIEPGAKKQWAATLDDRTRDTHDDADNQQVELDNTFVVGGVSLRFPGDPNGPAREIVNCRCVLTYEI